MAVDQKTIMCVLVGDRTKVLAYIWSIVRDETLAEDIFQDICVLAIEKGDTINDEQHLIHWSRQAARYKSLEAMRDRQIRVLTLDDDVLQLLEDNWQSHDDEPAPARGQALKHCLSLLSPFARKLVDLRYGEGISGKQLADSVDRKLNTVYVALSRTHRALRQCIERRLASKPGEAE